MRTDAVHKDTFRQINIDVPRMNPSIPLFSQSIVQEVSLEGEREREKEKLILHCCFYYFFSVLRGYCLYGQCAIQLVDMCKGSMIL